ncbi:hypothetical protein [Spirosoma areae]
MVKKQYLSTADQYYKLSVAELLRLIHAGILLLIQEVIQLKLAVFTLLELQADKLTAQKQNKLHNTDFDPEPLPAIQRMIEEIQQELDEDLRNGVYESGI